MSEDATGRARGAEPRTDGLRPEDLRGEFAVAAKRYDRPGPIADVRVHRLRRLVDERGFLMELYRDAPTHAGTAELAEFFAGVRTAQINFSTVSVQDYVKGLHYHLEQEDIWFCPPPSKMKIVLLDVRAQSPTSGRTQVLTAGDGNDLVVRIPPGVAHGYRALTNPCSLLYIVTRPFDIEHADEYRIPWDHPAVKDLWDVPNA